MQRKYDWGLDIYVGARRILRGVAPAEMAQIYMKGPLNPK